MNRNTKSENYYDEKYLSNQSGVAIDNIDLYKKIFQPHVTEQMRVLDYGCGAGILLSFLNCEYKIGVDINEDALKEAKKIGIDEVHKNLNKLKPNSMDLIVSNSALEHVPNPHQVLCSLYDLLKPNGKIIFRVPHETLGWNYKPGDWNYHLFTWSPMAIGNLFNDTGFSEIEVKIEKGKKPPLSKFFKLVYLEKFTSKLYRILRMFLDEFMVKSIAVDGYCIVYAKKN